MSKRDNKAAAAESRELVGMEFDEFTRRAPVKLLLALAKFAEPVDVTVLQFANESHALFQQQRERLARPCEPPGSGTTRTQRSAGGR